MTNFDRAKKVLDNLTAAHPTSGPALDALVQTQLGYLSREYLGLLRPQRAPVDYSDPATHIAYVYRVAAAHGQWLYHALWDAHTRVADVFDRDEIKVAAIGGGPGSDMLGVMKYSQSIGKTNGQVLFKLLDHEPSWAGVWAEFEKTYSSQRKLSFAFEFLDLTAGSPWTPSTSFLEADIFTFSFALSEVWAFNGSGSVSSFLHHVVTNSKPGAFFVYVDNGGPSFNAYVTPHFNRPDVNLIASSDRQRRLLGSDEQASVFGAYITRFGQPPKLTGNVSYRVWEKLP